jgi:class 3 adenylate cyclase
MADERKLATILFADLTGSTALAAEDDPERTRARLERFYDAMAAEIEAARGTSSCLCSRISSPTRSGS